MNSDTINNTPSAKAALRAYARPTKANKAAAQAHRQQAAAHRQSAHESFERCDTDGFLSQWASGLAANREEKQAHVIEHGGFFEFEALFTIDGEWVPATQIDGIYGPRWMITDETGKATGVFLPVRPVRRSTLANKGYTEGRVLRPARADIDGRGRGLSGTAWACIKPTTPSWVPPVAVLYTDRHAD